MVQYISQRPDVLQLKQLCSDFQQVPKDEELEKMIDEGKKLGERTQREQSKEFLPRHKSHFPWGLTADKGQVFFKPGKKGLALGGGTYKSLFMSLHLNTMQKVIVKRGSVGPNSDQNSLDEYVKEAEIAARFKEFKGLATLGSFGDYVGSKRKQPRHRFEFIEPLAKSDLLEFTRPSWHNKLSIGSQLALAYSSAKDIYDFHAFKHVHRDIKPDNLLVFEESGVLRAELTDFGLSDHADSITGYKGTLEYLPLEVLMKLAQPASCRGSCYDDFEQAKKGEVHSLGVTIFSIFMKSMHPFHEKISDFLSFGLFNTVSSDRWQSFHKQAQEKIQSMIAKEQDDAVRQVLKLVLQMTCANPDDRPDMATVVETLRALQAQASPRSASQGERGGGLKKVHGGVFEKADLAVMA